MKRSLSTLVARLDCDRGTIIESWTAKLGTPSFIKPMSARAK